MSFLERGVYSEQTNWYADELRAIVSTFKFQIKTGDVGLSVPNPPVAFGIRGILRTTRSVFERLRPNCKLLPPLFRFQIGSDSLTCLRPPPGRFLGMVGAANVWIDVKMAVDELQMIEWSSSFQIGKGVHILRFSNWVMEMADDCGCLNYVQETVSKLRTIVFLLLFLFCCWGWEKGVLSIQLYWLDTEHVFQVLLLKHFPRFFVMILLPVHLKLLSHLNKWVWCTEHMRTQVLQFICKLLASKHVWREEERHTKK